VLTPKAALMLDYLITHPDELLTRDPLLEVLWGFDFPVGTRAVDRTGCASSCGSTMS
jgi:DNA-binding response OmpR family regulator